ncbi:MAG: MerR family transcriptional regulator [Acidimicrobiales bacterium]
MPIGEFSERSGLSAKRLNLRTYAAEGLLVPAAVDPASGYRYYSPGQLHEAEVIDTLRQAGVPLADIRMILRQPSGDYLDAWARRLQVDAVHREEALDRAKRLLAVEAADTEMTTGGTPMGRLNAAARTETGPIRENNEDVTVTGDRLILVADGMGGPPGGEVAAGLTAALVETIFTGRSLDELDAVVRAANWTVWERSRATTELQGMGTTVCAAGLLDDGNLAVVNVGDSRAYVWHDGVLTQLTQDHSVTADLVRRGELEEHDAPNHPHYGVLTRALGVGPEITVDGAIYPIAIGDRFLLCSDGLFNEVSTDEIVSAVVKDGTLSAIADSLAALAASRGARDNVSVVVAEVAD